MPEHKRKSIPAGLGTRAKHTSRLVGSLASAGIKRLVRQNDADDLALGQALLKEMDQMKGMAMKVGQILSYMDTPLPSTTQGALARLQEGVEPLDFAAIQEVIEGAFGAPSAELFEALDPEAIAAASIGQVHKGCYQGKDVAVKVQYPGVLESFNSDMTQLGRLAKLASLAAGVDGAAIVQELHSRLREECDYALEASSQLAFRQAWAGDTSVTIPEVVLERSQARVLTTHFEEGQSFTDFLATSSQGERNKTAATLTRFAWHSFFVFQGIHADPHPGNYRFRGEGEVVFLDFGCIRRFETSFIDAWRALFLSVLNGDVQGFREATLRTGMVRTKAFDFDAHYQLMAYGLEPYLSANFRFNSDYSARGHKLMGPRQKNGRAMDIPPAWVWLARMQFGLHGVLTKLGAEGDFGSILTQALSATPRPL